MREMGTRDRVMGDCIYLGPQESNVNGETTYIGGNTTVGAESSRISESDT